ncbi:MAG: hypothetical protein H7270_02500 [Dermatophilaceae bacterium]|nr:hypothetical protein [Dermatophilaceae bacterium]
MSPAAKWDRVDAAVKADVRSDQENEESLLAQMVDDGHLKVQVAIPEPDGNQPKMARRHRQ